MGDNDIKKDKAELSIEASSIDFQLLKEIAIPVVAFAIGAVLHKSESTVIYGKLAMFFGAQTLMNLYMKQVLSGSVVDEEEGLNGIPSAFIVTALQQMVAFVLFGIIILILQLTPWAYTPKKLNTMMEWVAVILFFFFIHNEHCTQQFQYFAPASFREFDHPLMPPACHLHLTADCQQIHQ